MKTKFKCIFAFTLALMIIIGNIYIGAGAFDVFAESTNLPTITMGDNPPMTRDEFMDWREEKDIRFFNIEGSILPAGIFFDGYSAFH